MAAHFEIIETFTEGKQPPKNEDRFSVSEQALFLSDGATDKSGQSFDDRSGGDIASELVINACLQSSANGEELVQECTDALATFYREHNPKALEDSALRINASLVAARIVGDQVVLTQVGDSFIRVNGTDIYENNKLIDAIIGNARKQYIDGTGDVAGSRNFILPLLQVQHQYQNVADAPLGYGVIDGIPVPAKYIKTYTFPLRQIKTIELVSDGYYGQFPVEQSVAAYEALYAEMQAEDPDKYKKYIGTKPTDDRSLVIARLVHPSLESA